MSVTIKCPTHSRYKALKKPTADCQHCRDIYDLARALAPGVAYPADGTVPGKFFCNPYHCGRSWKDKTARDAHLDNAYAILD